MSHPEAADSKGSTAPSESGIRNHFNGIIFLVLGIIALFVLGSALFIRIHTHGMQQHRGPAPVESAAPTTP